MLGDSVSGMLAWCVSPRASGEGVLLRPRRLTMGQKKAKTYNTGDSLVVTDPTTSPALRGLCSGERTGPSVFHELWSYVLEKGSQDAYIAEVLESMFCNRGTRSETRSLLTRTRSHKIPWRVEIVTRARILGRMVGGGVFRSGIVQVVSGITGGSPRRYGVEQNHSESSQRMETRHGGNRS